jgi:hypothetical protein
MYWNNCCESWKQWNKVVFTVQRVTFLRLFCLHHRVALGPANNAHASVMVTAADISAYTSLTGTGRQPVLFLEAESAQKEEDIPIMRHMDRNDHPISWLGQPLKKHWRQPGVASKQCTRRILLLMPMHLEQCFFQLIPAQFPYFTPKSATDVGFYKQHWIYNEY